MFIIREEAVVFQNVKELLYMTPGGVIINILTVIILYAVVNTNKWYNRVRKEHMQQLMLYIKSDVDATFGYAANDLIFDEIIKYEEQYDFIIKKLVKKILS
jgi:hypothetical protein